MYDFLKKNSGKIAVSLAVVTLILVVVALILVSSGVGTSVTYIAGVTGCGSILSGIFYFAYITGIVDEHQQNHYVPFHEKEQEDTDGSSMMLSNRSTPQALNTQKMNAEDEHPRMNDLSKDPENAYVVTSGFFCTSDKQKKINRLNQQLDETFSNCTEQMSNENFDIDIINEVLHNHHKEVAFFLEQRETKCSAYFSPVTEENFLSESKNQPRCNHGLNELNELIGTYPKYSFYDSYSIETLTSFAEARQEHHERVLSVANAVLPELRVLLNEAKDKVATLQNMNPS